MTGHGRWPADPAWGAAYSLLPDWVGTWYDDVSLFANHYTGIKQHIDQLGRYAAANNAGGTARHFRDFVYLLFIILFITA